MINKDQGSGIIERVLYGGVVLVVGKFIKDPDLSAYIAAGVVTAAGSAWAWWINRPTALLNAAANTVPASSKLVIETPQDASPLEKSEARALATAATDKVVAKIVV